jgi:excisionase family DNA binding protein
MDQQEVYKTVFKEYPDILDVTQMSMLLRVSKKTAYKLLKQERIDCLKVGREYKILKANIIRYLRIEVNNKINK